MVDIFKELQRKVGLEHEDLDYYEVNGLMETECKSTVPQIAQKSLNKQYKLMLKEKKVFRTVHSFLRKDISRDLPELKIMTSTDMESNSSLSSKRSSFSSSPFTFFKKVRFMIIQAIIL